MERSPLHVAASLVNDRADIGVLLIPILILILILILIGYPFESWC